MPNDQRRHDVRGSGPSRSPQRWEIHQGASVDKNMFVETTVAHPNYEFTRTFTGSGGGASDLDPTTTSNVTTPNRFDMVGFYGLNGYVVLTTVASVNLELWCLDQENDVFFKVATVSSLATLEGFDFSAKAKNRICFIRCATSLAAGEVCVIRATGE